jgi:hypothetical protein
MNTKQRITRCLVFAAGLTGAYATLSCGLIHPCECPKEKSIQDDHYATCDFDEAARAYDPEFFVPFPHVPSAFRANSYAAEGDRPASFAFEYVVDGETVTVVYEQTN